ncbi:hypothetical protein [Eubacterium sp. An3]|uniref:hypothetical protein n=1 Tax=Eubacterium sp. An3 TaxID=1965628 RepID=UPI000B371ABE|nr:hypothetical protein [Eubacterium sp. An3]OUO27648.1 hypothetical protein B5F87_10085 [Eubacterium sp. An3]
MFTVFNSESLWIGTDLKLFNRIRDALKDADIPYKYKTKNHLSDWGGHGTVRGRTGSIGNPTDQMYQYEIFVYSKDYERARRLI